MFPDPVAKVKFSPRALASRSSNGAEFSDTDQDREWQTIVSEPPGERSPKPLESNPSPKRQGHGALGVGPQGPVQACCAPAAPRSDPFHSA